MDRSRRTDELNVPVVGYAEFLLERQKRARERADMSGAQAERALLALDDKLNDIVDQIVILAATHETPGNNLRPRIIFMIECMKAAAKERLGLQPKR